MKKKYIIAIIVTVVAVSAFVGIGVMGKSKEKNNINKTSIVYTIPQSPKVYINGIIEPESYKDIYLDGAKGKVSSTNVKSGQVVKKGDLLFTYTNEQTVESIESYNEQLTSTIKQRDINAKNINDLKSKLEVKKKELKSRQIEIVSISEALSNLEDSYNTQIKSLEDQIVGEDIQISALKEKIAKAKEKQSFNVLAPIDGTVTIREIETNMTKPYMTIENSTLCVNGTVNEKDKLKLSEGSPVEILIYGSKTTVHGKITAISTKPTDKADASGNGGNNQNASVSTYQVKIAFDSQENLINGFHVQATVTLNGQATKVPSSAIVTEDGKSYVFKVQDGIIKKSEVKCGNSEGDRVVITEGLKPGDNLVEVPNDSTKEGNKVE